MKKILMLFLICTVLFTVQAQEDDILFDNHVENEFKSLMLINLQTNRTIPLKSFEFNIMHRFGMADVNKDFVKNFIGLDLPANIRFGFAVPVTKRFYLGIGRANINKIVDMEAKYNLLQQTEDDKSPVFLSLYTSAFARTYAMPALPKSDSLFHYKTNHRFSYFTQLIVARKMNSYLSLLVAPGFLYRNLVESYESNGLLILPAGFRVKTSFNGSIIGEYTYIPNKVKGLDDVFSLAYEIATAGHSFQIVLSNNNRISIPLLYSTQSANPLDGQFFIGFNIHRKFFLTDENE